MGLALTAFTALAATHPELVSKAKEKVAEMVADSFKSAGGKRFQGLLQGNHDLEKAVFASWSNASKALRSKYKIGFNPSEDEKNRFQVFQQIEQWGNQHLEPKNPRFPNDLTEALVLNEVGNFVIFVRVMLDECLRACQFVVPEELKREFAEKLYHEFALVIKHDDHAAAMKAVTRDCLWELLGYARETNSRLQEVCDSIASTKEELDPKIDLEAISTAMISQFEELLKKHLGAQTEEIKTHIDGGNQNILQAIETLQKDFVHKSEHERRLAEETLKAAKAQEEREIAEMTARERQAKIEEQQRLIDQLRGPSPLLPTAAADLIERAWEHVRQLKFVAAVELAERARALDPKNPYANYVSAYALSVIKIGDFSANQNDAITRYQACLRAWSQSDFPRDWAMTQNNLGNAYSQLPTGDRGVNLARAIGCYEAALRVYTESDFPQDWATTQNNLGNAYQNLPTGDRAFNLARAIAAYEAALRVRTESDFPQNWATTQNNLGNAYQNLPTGDRAFNLARAIAAYEAALRVRTESDFPQNWAMTQNNLGNAYSQLPTGDRGVNLALAIACYEAALRVYTESDFPQDWAMTQNNLGNAFQNLPTGDRGVNLALAIACYEAALRVYTESDFPQDWARTQNNLGNAYQNLPTGDRAFNLARAIGCYEAALRVYTESDFPQNWAMTQNNLGNAYKNLPTGDRGVNLARAIGCYEAALRVYTESDFPQNWAMTQNNLGNAYKNLPTGDRGVNLARAIGCYEAALRVYTESDFPQEWAMTTANIANLCATLGDLANAIKLMRRAAAVCRQINTRHLAEQMEADADTMQSQLEGS